MSEREKAAQTSVRSFRVTDEVAEKIKQIQTDLKLTTDSALKRILQAYELEVAKDLMPERETEIANFQVKAQELVDAYLHSLQLNQDAEIRIRAEFEQKLRMQERAILDCQDKNEALLERNSELIDQAEKVQDLQKQLEDLERKSKSEKMELEERLAEKERFLRNLDKQLAEAEEKAAGYDDLRADRDDLKDKLTGLTAEMKDVLKDHAMELERRAFQADMAQREAVSVAEAAGAAVADELRRQMQEKEVAAARDLQAAEKRAHDADNAAAAEIRKLEQEIARLREMLALQTKENGNEDKTAGDTN